MFIKLPSYSNRKYSGKYPARINSFSSSKGTYHFELNNGSRYVARDIIFSPRGLRSSIVNAEIPDLVCNADSEDYLNAPEMTLDNYMGILLVCRLVQALKPGVERIFLQTGVIKYAKRG